VPKLSAFTKLGILRLQGRPSEAEKIYRSLVASLGKPGQNYTVERGSREDAWCYANAVAFAVGHLTLIHAGRQIQPSCVYEYLADREQEWGIVPPPDSSILDRRAVLAARELLPRGARREAVVAALTQLLLDDFVFYRTTKPSEIQTWPLAGGDQPMLLAQPGVPNKLYALLQPVSFNLGTPQPVLITIPPLVSPQPDLVAGDKLIVDPGNFARAEVVTVESVDSTNTSFVGTFNNPHDPGAVLSTAAWPAWVSTQRENLIVVSASAAVDPVKRQQIGALLERILRGVSTWQIAAVTSGSSLGGTAGPFKIGVSPLGATPLGMISFP
jgi:hypothetical protein